MAGVTSVTGMILSAMPVGEYDRRVVLLTKEYGKISAFAKGARKQNNSLVGVTRPFIFGTFEVYQGRDSYTIYKAQAINYFEELVSDINAVLYGYYFNEIADYYGIENVDCSDLINLLYISLKALMNNNISNELVRYIYELRIIAINGECPDFFTCHKCSSTEDLSVYSLSRNGVFCQKCAEDVYDGISLSTSTLYTLQYIITSQLSRLYTFTVTDEVFSELKMVVNRLESITFDREFKSKEMLNI